MVEHHHDSCGVEGVAVHQFALWNLGQVPANIALQAKGLSPGPVPQQDGSVLASLQHWPGPVGPSG